MRIVALALCSLLIAVATAHADGNALLRFYYSPQAAGVIHKSPADPNGKDSGEAVDSTWKSDLELILWGHLGISGSRQSVLREFNNGSGQKIQEEWVQFSTNLSLYLRQAGYNRFNVYAGAGTGQVEKYHYSVDDVRQDTRRRNVSMPLSRTFAGIDYTFERIGFRYEYNTVEVEKDSPGFKDKISQTYQHIGFFIPFN